MVLLVYPPEGGGRINRNTMTKGVIKCLLPLIGRCYVGNSRAHKPTSEFQIAAKETMAEAFHLEVDGWDSEQDSTPLQDSVSENSSPGNEQSAKRRKTQHKF